MTSQKKQSAEAAVRDIRRRTRRSKCSSLTLADSAELEIGSKVQAWLKSPSDSLGYVEAGLDAARTVEKTVKLMEKMSEARSDLANRGKRLASARVKLVVARNKLLTEDRVRAAGEALSGTE